MRILLSILICFIASNNIAWSANTKYCGQLKKVSFQTNIYTEIHMGVQNLENRIKHVSIKDEEAIQKVIRVIKKDPEFTHRSDEDDFSWHTGFEKENFQLCLEGSPLRKTNGWHYMDQVQKLTVSKVKKKRI